MRISDWSSDVCASDLAPRCNPAVVWQYRLREVQRDAEPCRHPDRGPHGRTSRTRLRRDLDSPVPRSRELCPYHLQKVSRAAAGKARNPTLRRSEEHTSELQSLMRISYAVFCLKKK